MAAAALLLAGLAGPAPAGSAPSRAVAYLDSLRGKANYVAPGEIDARFTIALYVNVAVAGPNAQRMWVLQRSGLDQPWRLGLWDEELWGERPALTGAEPAYSWPISSGRRYRGDSRSMVTPQGVFTIDERDRRVIQGQIAPEIIHALFLDYHYASGRRSGLAFHGTLPRYYAKLGTADSHGCIRMRQRNALALLHRVTGRDGHLASGLRWGEVPRFWRLATGKGRWGYRLDGRLLREGDGLGGGISGWQAREPREAGAPLLKTGYRVIAIMFADGAPDPSLRDH